MAEDDVSQWIPSITDDYTVGKVTLTAGSKDITFKDAFNGAEKSYTAGDSIYVPSEGRWLLLKEITSTTKGTLLYPCPESCAGTFDLLIRPLARNARQAGLATMVLRNLNVGNLPGLANAKLKTGQILVASQIDGSFDAKDLNADNVAETEKRKFMPADFNADSVKETDARKVMTAAERNKLAGIAGLEQSKWNNGSDTTEALISPLKFLATLDALGVWRGGYRFGTATSSGFVLPNGMIVQFGTTWPPATDYRMNFPLTFPNACGFFTVIGAYNIDTNRYIAVSTSNIGVGGADIRSRDIYGGSVGGVHTFPCYWFAVGF